MRPRLLRASSRAYLACHDRFLQFLTDLFFPFKQKSSLVIFTCLETRVISSVFAEIKHCRFLIHKNTKSRLSRSLRQHFQNIRRGYMMHSFIASKISSSMLLDSVSSFIGIYFPLIAPKEACTGVWRGIIIGNLAADGIDRFPVLSLVLVFYVEAVLVLS